MLVLSRKVGESIIIDGHIKVTITKIDGNKIKIGVEAPKDVAVDRAEIAERRQQWDEPAHTLVSV